MNDDAVRSNPAPAAAQEPDCDLSELALEGTNELVRRLAEERPADGRYEPRGDVAVGGMAKILRTWDARLRRTLAMKVIRWRERDDDGSDAREDARRRTVARFLEEAQITSQLDHPGIVPVHDLGIDANGHFFFTMRLVRGRTFGRVLELLRRGADGWTLARALGVVIKVCETLAYAHARGVIHRDLKPANVMVGRFGEVYVMDWGLARVVGRPDSHDLRLASAIGSDDDVSHIDTVLRRDAAAPELLTRDGHVVGTPCYMSPEQARGDVERLDARADVYGVGALLYELLAGEAPYLEGNPRVEQEVVLTRLRKRAPKPVQDLAPSAPEDLVRICERAMARRPEDRYCDTLDLAHDLEAFLTARPVTVHEPTFRYVARLFLRRNKKFAVTISAALVALLTVAAVAWRNDREAFRRNQRLLGEKSQLLDVRTARVLASSVDDLLPPIPENAPRMRRWIGDVDALLQKQSSFSGDLETMNYLDRLRAIEPFVRQWARRAETLVHDSLETPAAVWTQAIEAIATSPKYSGLRIRPQLGLVPLGFDKRSGLCEFYAALSGEPPVLAPDLRCGYDLAEDTAIVFVLLPGGVVTLGSPEGEPDRRTNEGQRVVTLPPFFMSKFELTQAQWVRVMGRNPSLYGSGSEPRAAALLHPVESVSALEADKFVHDLALALPTEDEWEYASRGGTTTRFWWGDDVNACADADGAKENFGDEARKPLSDLPTFPWNDNFPFHAPVGSFAGNPFGLFDVLGNVSEWCSNDYVDESATPVAGPLRCWRGGNWVLFSPGDCRAARRFYENPRALHQGRGLRSIRPIDR